jgi:hypothetical protein
MSAITALKSVLGFYSYASLLFFLPETSGSSFFSLFVLLIIR